MYSAMKYAWDIPPIHTLGIYVDVQFEKMGKLNLEPLVEKVEQVIESWKKRPLTLMGHILIVNTLIESLFVYQFSVFPIINTDILKGLQQKITSFIWKGKRPKISNNILKSPKDQGGLCLVDLEAKHLALIAQWPFLIQGDKFLEVSCYEQFNPTLKQDIWLTNLNETDVDKLFSHSFWKYVLVAWSKCVHFLPMTYDEVMSQLLWYNSYIRINNQPVFYRNLYKSGCKHVRDIHNGQEFMSYHEFISKFPETVTWLQYEGLIQSIPHR